MPLWALNFESGMMKIEARAWLLIFIFIFLSEALETLITTTIISSLERKMQTFVFLTKGT